MRHPLLPIALVLALVGSVACEPERACSTNGAAGQCETVAPYLGPRGSLLDSIRFCRMPGDLVVGFERASPCPSESLGDATIPSHTLEQLNNGQVRRCAALPQHSPWVDAGVADHTITVVPVVHLCAEVGLRDPDGLPGGIPAPTRVTSAP